MAITLCSNTNSQLFLGLSSDPKPVHHIVKAGDRFYEIDSTVYSVFTGTAWIPMTPNLDVFPYMLQFP